ncbi:MAG: UDP-N-acetylmuramoyl-tripeptide--D-alanyl-D-alanine ligase [bacterium]
MLKTQSGGRPETLIEGISIDSRSITPGELFWALKGDNFDGHNFVSDAFKKGAIGAVVSDEVDDCPDDRFLIKTENTLHSLWKLGKHMRTMSNAQVIAVTGSSGKTSTKELIAHVLERKFNVLKSFGNFNNHIGLPLTLIKIGPQHEYVVVEMGMNARGEIAQLTKLADPNIGIITNIGHAHIGLLGSREQIFEAKAELLHGMDTGGLVVLNQDCSYVDKLRGEYSGKVITVGTEPGADYQARQIKILPFENRMSFVVNVDAREHLLSVPLLGEKLMSNVLMAIAVAIECGMSIEEVKKALSSCKALPGRMSIESFKQITIIDDSYNANPESMRSSLNTLDRCKGNARAIAVLGDMLELGDHSKELHKELGRWITQHISLDMLILYGEFAQIIADGAAGQGMSKDRILHFTHKEDSITFLARTLQPGDWLLFKGSRGMGMEHIIKGLRQRL